LGGFHTVGGLFFFAAAAIIQTPEGYIQRGEGSTKFCDSLGKLVLL